MESNRWIKESEWFCAIEGLAIADKVYDFYFEEYDCENNRLYGRHFS